MSTLAKPFGANLVAMPSMDDKSMSTKDDIPVLEDIFEPAASTASPHQTIGNAPDPVLLAEISEAVTDRARRLTSCLLEHHLKELELALSNEVSERLNNELPGIIEATVERYVARHKP